MGTFISLVIGILIGRFFLTKELGIKIHNKIYKKKSASISNNQNQSIERTVEQKYEICSMCHGSGDLIDRVEQRYIKCPQCEGTGTIPINNIQNKL